MFVEGALHPKQVEGLRRLSLQQRLDLGLQFIEQAFALRTLMLRAQHPDWTEERIAEALRASVRNART